MGYEYDPENETEGFRSSLQVCGKCGGVIYPRRPGREFCDGCAPPPAAPRGRRPRPRGGLSEDDYAKLLFAQAGKCGICSHIASAGKRRLAVNYDHRTGQIRGLLCSFCNQVVAAWRGSPERFEGAAAFLRRGATSGVNVVFHKSRKPTP